MLCETSIVPLVQCKASNAHGVHYQHTLSYNDKQ